MVLAGGGGAVYLSIGGGGSTSNTAVALTDCTMTSNTAGLCLARHLLIQVDICVCDCDACKTKW